MQIIPALYIKDGKAAIYTPSDYENLDYLPQSPYDLIDQIGKYNIRRIHLVDIDASLDNGKDNRALIGSLANVSIPNLEVGGGIRQMEYLKSLQYAGVDYFVLGSVVMENEPFLTQIQEAKHIRNDRIMISLDILNGQLTTHGWVDTVTGHTAESIIEKCLEQGFSRFICTDIDSEGPDRGPDLAFYESLVERFPQAIFSASGQIRTFADVDKLRKLGVHEVIVGNEIFKEDGLLEKISVYNSTHMEE
jgi:phosphoribosylformimino-5-aminoimidazole carboxamide ribotide isomerase